MFKFRLLIGCFLSLMLVCSSSIAGQTPIKIRLFLQENLDAQGKQVPADPKLTDILRYFEREANVRFDAVILPWKRAQFETLAGKGIIYGFSRSAERLRHYYFSQPVISERVWAISYGLPKPDYRAVDDLHGKVVSIGRGFSHGMEFDQARDVVFTVQEDSASVAARFKKLIAKRSDLMLWPVRQFEHSSQVEHYINTMVVPDSLDPDLKGQKFNVSDQPIFYDTVHFATAKGHYQEVIDRIDVAIARGSKNGSLAKVLRGYH